MPNRVAKIYATLNNSCEAQECVERALALFRKLEDKPREGNGLMLLGRLHMVTQEYESAKKDFEEALKAFMDMGNHVGQGFCIASFDDMRERLTEYFNAFCSRPECLQWLGDAHVMLDQTEEAKRYYTDALRLYRDLRDFDGGALCRTSLASLLAATKDCSGALALYEEASKMYAERGDQSRQAEFLHKSGEMQECLEQYEQAWRCFEQALALYRSNNDKQGEARCLRGLAGVHFHRHQNDAAMLKYKEALKLYEGTDPSDELAAIYWDLGEACMEGGRRDDAVRWMEQAAELYESILEADQARQARSQAEEWRRT